MIKASKAKFSSLKFGRLAGEMYHQLPYPCIPDIMNIYKLKTAFNIGLHGCASKGNKCGYPNKVMKETFKSQSLKKLNLEVYKMHL